MNTRTVNDWAKFFAWGAIVVLLFCYGCGTMRAGTVNAVNGGTTGTLSWTVSKSSTNLVTISWSVVSNGGLVYYLRYRPYTGGVAGALTPGVDNAVLGNGASGSFTVQLYPDPGVSKIDILGQGQNGAAFNSSGYGEIQEYGVTSGPGAGSRKAITVSYVNPEAFGVWCGVVRTSATGQVFQISYVAPGQTYTATFSVPSASTEVFQVVVVDADQAFIDGGGEVDYYPDETGTQGGNVYDFTGYTTAVGTTYTAAANGVVAGQSQIPGAGIVAPSGPSEPVPATSVSNPRYRGISGIGSADVESVKNTNAITGAIKDLQDAFAGGITVNVPATDMSGVTSRLDTLNNSVAAGNTKTDTSNTHLSNINGNMGDVKTKLDSIASKSDTLNTNVVAGNALQTSTNTKLDGVNAQIGTTNTKLDQVNVTIGTTNTKLETVATRQADTNTKLDSVNNGLSAIGSKLDTANEKLEAGNVQRQKLADFVDSVTQAGTSYDNGAQVSAAQAAAGGVASYAGVKPTVGGQLSTTFPSGPASWGKASIGGTDFNFTFSSVELQGMDGLMVASRSLLLLAMCLGFCRQASGLVTKYTTALPQVVTQDTATGPENLAPGMSQAKTFGTAAVAVGVIFAGAASIVAIVDTYVAYYGGGVASIFSAINFPAASAAGAIDRYVPLGAGLGLTVMGVALPYIVAPLFLGTAGILRFLKT